MIEILFLLFVLAIASSGSKKAAALPQNALFPGPMPDTGTGDNSAPESQAIVNTPGGQLLSDGTYDYVLVRPQSIDAATGATNVALYERVPQDPVAQYTPSLDFLQGLTSVPVMIPIAR